MIPYWVRLYSTAKPSIKLVAELRKATGVSITKARDALVASNGDLTAAIEWVQKHLIVAGATKATKIANRNANQGLIALSVLSKGCGKVDRGVRAAMVELNCETDFVARNEQFGKLASDIAHTAAFLSEEDVNPKTILNPCSLDMLNNAPLQSAQSITGTPQLRTIADSISELIARVGEKVTLRRALVVVRSKTSATSPTIGHRIASYAHGFDNPFLGRMGTLAFIRLQSANLPTLLQSDAFTTNFDLLERSISRQIVGFRAETVRSSGSPDSASLYDSPFMMLNGSEEPVGLALQNWSHKFGLIEESEAESTSNGVHVLEFANWTVGEPVEAVHTES
jgi:elongation factor Ts